jgi:hypothetical protein
VARSLTQHFADWCRQQGDREYVYADNSGCALCQFLETNGYAKMPRAGGDYWYDAALGYSRANEHMLDKKLGYALVCTPHTFSALADRLAA